MDVRNLRARLGIYDGDCEVVVLSISSKERVWDTEELRITDVRLEGKEVVLMCEEEGENGCEYRMRD